MAVPTAPGTTGRTPALAAPGRRPSRVAANAVLVLIGVCFLVPLAWLFLSAVDPGASARTSLPDTVSTENFRAVLTADIALRPLLISFVLSLGSATVTVLAAVLASYPLSRYQMRFSKPFLYTVLFGTSLPVTAIMVPVFSLAVRTGLLDSIWATALFMAATSLPMAIWMTKNFMDSVPVSLEEAAWMDGAPAMTALRRIVVPLMRPGLTVVFIYVFMQAWGNFFVPFLLLRSPEKQPAAVTIYQFFGQFGAIDYGQLAAFSLLYSLPVIVLYVIVSRSVGGSFAMSGAVKG
ncbi:carbohydrate ABC transporter permease [Cellulomonas fimi]|uniref:Carbohydrate ABC transporter permease n=1 Tax=Cellulomonas fimi TaxID=1708 RepID=A0A7Y0QI22_CELFI|nr:carbohydrate ABC transporter permease [Cellulomonas fimi]NMR19802.1 carbohydrate ABC transporter permease [Cellulomonas fimi]